ncbi:transcriptional regulator [Schinkia azotoformans MEV2011]|uniref:Transcriptional regulator n=1 Tax=Schinkia azotoformans MEV2011 TaxID=1348973 RepID=A0A072NGC5_SCHAZ|nr:LysR substrate-binding domain-containing protein [Schinkia azotoformans]KEF36749.1 transcriptional regulator [Schinkia azotoformans MEV2011]MEC1698226.1 LysR substrate-binding domain-containing protein [Schinkia azotoformans]MEC1718535.1 LysR substrate-binding domain-containing protein [Schinkia azotoformans]MEC1727580.1 LysR substrate-binding domain-containing protein [Schinkia azotoformans]MEC1743673.1 LysR substrate-binding domain-containing protein [Schinkia azotoformans]
MSINKYKVFKKVVELGSLTKAAEALGFTQSGVSHLINSLEDEVGFLLLSRNRSGVKLTENGEMILKTVSEILKWNEHLEQQVASIHGIELGTIHIGTFTSVSVNWLPGIIKDFQRDYPNISVNFIEGDYREIEDWIADGKIDCGFLSLPTRDTFDVLPLAKDQMLVLLPIDHPLSTKPVLSLADIMEEPFIMQRKGGDDDINRVIEDTPFKPKIKYTVADDYAIMAMVEKGLGISILPELVLRGQQRKIRLIGLKEPKYRSLGIAVNLMKQVSPATKRFLDYVQTYPELKV